VNKCCFVRKSGLLVVIVSGVRGEGQGVVIEGRRLITVFVFLFLDDTWKALDSRSMCL